MVAIIGATGLLGQHIVERFVAEGIDIVALHRPGNEGSLPAGVTRRPADILDEPSLREALDGAKSVIHAAAFVSFNPRLRKKIFEVNVEGTRHVVNTCLKLGVENLIHISSVSALGRKPGELITEESKWTGDFSSDYGESKYLAELEVFRGAEEGLTVSMVNPSVILSGSQPHSSSASLFDYVWQEGPFYTKGALNYVDARDVAEAVLQLHHKPLPGEKIILSAGSVPYLDFFSQVALHFKRKPPSISISPILTYWLGWAEEVRSFLLSREPMVTRETARQASQSFLYNSSKATEKLDMKFRSLESSISWCCEAYLRNVKPNK
jgi:dihydroflavonol-4-reductase